jgi:hypothetical protein
MIKWTETELEILSTCYANARSLAKEGEYDNVAAFWEDRLPGRSMVDIRKEAQNQGLTTKRTPKTLEEKIADHKAEIARLEREAATSGAMDAFREYVDEVYDSGERDAEQEFELLDSIFAGSDADSPHLPVPAGGFDLVDDTNPGEQIG